MTLNQNEFPDGLYTSLKPWWLNAAANFPDYAGAAALFAWLTVILAWWLHPRRRETRSWAWVPWTAAGGILASIFWFLSVTILADDSEVIADLATGGALLLTAVGLWVSLAGFSTVRTRVLGVTLAAVAIAVGAWRLNEPGSGAWMIVALLSGGAIAWQFAAVASGWARAALGVLALYPFVSLVGPTAVDTFTMLRHSPGTFMVVAAGATQTLAAGLTLIGLARDALGQWNAAERAELRREARPYLVAGALIIFIGVGLAVVMGNRNRQGQIAATLQRMHAVAAHLDLALIARCLGPELRLDRREMQAVRYFAHPVARPRHLAGGLARPIEAQLREALRAQSGVVALATIVTLREGWLVVAISSPRRGPDRAGRPTWQPINYVTLGRRATPDDLIAWAQRADVFEGPLPIGNNHLDYFRVPLVTPEGRMLGWLQYNWSNFAHNIAAFNVRSAFFVLTALGLTVTGVIFQQSRMARQRAAAGRAAEIAAEASRLKSAFLASVSHELRTPLQTIRGYGELLQRELDDASARDQLDALRRDSDRLLEVVTDLLDLSAIEAGAVTFEQRAVPLPALIAQLADSFRPRARQRGLTLRAEIAADVPAWIQFDPDRLRQMVRPLLDRALHAGAGGEIVVALDVVEQLGPACRIRFAVTVADPAASAASSATDTRLALTAALVRQAGGTLHESTSVTDGVRSEFTFATQIATAPPTTPAASLRQRRILVADDNPLVRELFVAHLGELGAHCDTAADGETALALARSGGHDALVLDLAMPGRDGLDVARTLRAEGHRLLRIVGVSAHASGGDRATALASGMDAFLTKPVELAALAAALADTTLPEEPGANTAALKLRERLTELFRADAPAQATAIADALARRDWPALRTAAHYLKGSASVVRDDALFAACGALEDAAVLGDTAAAAAAHAALARALTRWQ